MIRKEHPKKQIFGGQRNEAFKKHPTRRLMGRTKIGYKPGTETGTPKKRIIR